MNRKVVLVVALATFVLLGLACRGRREGGMYDPATVATLKGTIKSLDSVDRNGLTLVQIMLDTGSGAVRVSLGPDSYVSEQSVKLAEGDTVTVQASKVTVRDKTFFVAATVTKGADILHLRDPATGKPLWPRMAPGG